MRRAASPAYAMLSASSERVTRWRQTARYARLFDARCYVCLATPRCAARKSACGYAVTMMMPRRAEYDHH